MTVTGWPVSDGHTGKVRRTPTGAVAAFPMPDKPFTPSGRRDGVDGAQYRRRPERRVSFTVATPTRHRLNRGDLLAARTPRDVLRFHSRPDLMPVAVHVTKRPSHTAPWRHLHLAVARAAAEWADGPRSTRQADLVQAAAAQDLRERLPGADVELSKPS